MKKIITGLPTLASLKTPIFVAFVFASVFLQSDSKAADFSENMTISEMWNTFVDRYESGDVKCNNLYIKAKQYALWNFNSFGVDLRDLKPNSEYISGSFVIQLPLNSPLLNRNGLTYANKPNRYTSDSKLNYVKTGIKKFDRIGGFGNHVDFNLGVVDMVFHLDYDDNQVVMAKTIMFRFPYSGYGGGNAYHWGTDVPFKIMKKHYGGNLIAIGCD